VRAADFEKLKEQVQTIFKQKLGESAIELFHYDEACGEEIQMADAEDYKDIVSNAPKSGKIKLFIKVSFPRWTDG